MTSAGSINESNNWTVSGITNYSMRQQATNGHFYFTPFEGDWHYSWSKLATTLRFRTQTNGTVSLAPGQIYVFNLGLTRQGSGFSGFACSNSSVKLKAISGQSVYFYSEEQLTLSSLVFRFDFPATQLNTLYPNGPGVLVNFGFSFCNIQTLTGFTSDDSSADIIAAIDNQTDVIGDKIDDQYSVDPNDSGSISDFGGSQSDAVAGQLSALDYASEISSQMFSLFAETPGPPVLTFPAFHMDIDGQTYDIWQDIDFNFSSLLPDFEVLISAIRFILVALCYIAFVKFLQGVYISIIHNKTLEEGVDES